MPTVFVSKGMQLIGQIIATAFSGIAFAQAYDYFSLYRKDPLGLKAFVGVMISLILFALCGQTISLFNSVITQAGVDKPHFPLMHYVPLYTNVIVIGMAQSFFVQRAYKAWASNKIVAGVISGVLASLVFFDTATWFFVNFNSQKTNDATTGAEVLADVLVLNKWVVINSAASCATDVAISAILALKLFMAKRSGGGFSKETDSVIGRLLQMTMGTAAITSIITLFVLIAVKVQPLGASYHLLLGDSTAVSAASCVLYCLNSRQRLRLLQAGVTSSRSVGGAPTTAYKAGGKSFADNNTGVVAGIAIQLETYTQTQVDREDDDIEKGQGPASRSRGGR